MWLVVVFLFGGVGNNTPSDSLNRARNDKIIEEEVVKRLLEERANINRIAKQQAMDEHAKKNMNGLKDDDHDHPEEEKKKADEQQKNPIGKIQINAPKEPHNPNAPGKHFFLVFNLGNFLILIFYFWGELGKAVYIDKEKLSPEELRKYDAGWKDNAFNNYVSDMISLHRTLADIRDPACKAVKWYSPLPKTSVIVIFHNEAWSVLLRTVHSVLDRSDPNVLEEIIVVDDYSDFRK